MNQLLKYHISHASGLYLGGPYSYLGKKQYDKKHVEKNEHDVCSYPVKNIFTEKIDLWLAIGTCVVLGVLLILTIAKHI